MHDLVVRNGKVADGSGGPLRRADVAIEGERIVAVGGGYRTTIKRGVPTYREGSPTGRLPGRLIRGPQSA